MNFESKKISRVAIGSCLFGYIGITILNVADAYNIKTSPLESKQGLIISLITLIFLVISIYWGYKALKDIKSNPWILKGRWVAIIGIILGGLGIFSLIMKPFL